MSTSLTVNEPTSPQDRTRAYEPPRLRDRIRGIAEGGTGAVIAVLFAVGLACLVANAIYQTSLAGPVELGNDVGQFFVGP
jgi:hypothetical protein